VPFSIDKHFKILSDDDPRMTLALFAGIPTTEDLEVEPLDCELNVETLRADNFKSCPLTRNYRRSFSCSADSDMAVGERFWKGLRTE